MSRANRRNNGPTMGVATIRLRSPQNDPSLPSERRAVERARLLKKQARQFQEVVRGVDFEDTLEAALGEAPNHVADPEA
jgi:hypothetical protein